MRVSQRGKGAWLHGCMPCMCKHRHQVVKADVSKVTECAAVDAAFGDLSFWWGPINSVTFLYKTCSCRWWWRKCGVLGGVELTTCLVSQVMTLMSVKLSFDVVCSLKITWEPGSDINLMQNVRHSKNSSSGACVCDLWVMTAVTSAVNLCGLCLLFLMRFIWFWTSVINHLILVHRKHLITQLNRYFLFYHVFIVSVWEGGVRIRRGIKMNSSAAQGHLLINSIFSTV